MYNIDVIQKDFILMESHNEQLESSDLSLRNFIETCNVMTMHSFFIVNALCYRKVKNILN